MHQNEHHHHHSATCNCGCQHAHTSADVTPVESQHTETSGCGHHHGDGEGEGEGLADTEARNCGPATTSCSCGHDHGHEHEHTHEDCGCGHHHHDHEHTHPHPEPASREVAAALATNVASTTPLVFRIEGLDCPDCAAKLAQVVRRQAGVIAADISYAAGELKVFADSALDTQQLGQVIRQLGYKSHLLAGPSKAGTAKMRIEGLDCPDCAAKLEQQLVRLPGVTYASLSFSAGVLTFSPATAQAQILSTVERAGYRGVPLAAALSKTRVETNEPTNFWLKNRRSLLTIISGVFLAAGWGAELVMHDALLSKTLFVLGMLTGGFYVARSGFYALLNRSLDMNFLMTVAAVGAVAIGEWHEGAMVVFLFSLGNTLQVFTMDKTRQSIRSLMELAPKEAQVRRDGEELTLPVEEIVIGDVIIVRPGERIAMDGIVRQGNSAVNQAPITGESIPVDKAEGDRVFAGSINGNGSLEVVVDHLVADNTLSRIMHLVEEAQSQRAPSQQLVDRFAAYYTPVVILLAVAMATIPPLLGYDFASWFKRALIMLVVSCPCALVISTPVSIVSAIGNASRNGVLIKGGAYLEAMGKVRTIAFDKTGTLTLGQVRLSQLLSLNCDQESLLMVAAALEARSEHPLAQAIVRAAQELQIELPPVADFQALTGSGATGWVKGHQFWIGNQRLVEQVGLQPTPDVLEAVARLQTAGHTVVYLFDQKYIYGLLALSDEVRPEAIKTVAGLRQAGVQSLVMLTGDNKRTAAAIGQQVGVDEVQAELLPADKVEAINSLANKYNHVAMVGDGVNDAPALAAATVGIALGVAGTDTAIETADVALMADDLTKLPWLMRLSRKTVGIIGQNIVLSLAIKGVVLILTFMGRSELWMGVLADTGAALLVIANGMRLMRSR